MSENIAIRRLLDSKGRPIPFKTGLGRNGIRAFQLLQPDGTTPEDITGQVLKLVMKTTLDASDTELNPLFPLLATITDAVNGQFQFNFSLVNFLTEQSQVILVTYDDSGAEPVPRSYEETFIHSGGID